MLVEWMDTCLRRADPRVVINIQKFDCLVTITVSQELPIWAKTKMKPIRKITVVAGNGRFQILNILFTPSVTF